ncbi:hypothetical protein [Streptomyces nigrescens]
MTETTEPSPPNRQAFVLNALTDALSAAGDRVPLSVRAAATRAALAEIDAWRATGDLRRMADGTQQAGDAR